MADRSRVRVERVEAGIEVDGRLWSLGNSGAWCALGGGRSRAVGVDARITAAEKEGRERQAASSDGVGVVPSWRIGACVYVTFQTQLVSFRREAGDPRTLVTLVRDIIHPTPLPSILCNYNYTLLAASQQSWQPSAYVPCRPFSTILKLIMPHTLSVPHYHLETTMITERTAFSITAKSR